MSENQQENKIREMSGTVHQIPNLTKELPNSQKYRAQPKVTAFCSWSFVSDHNGYRYCGDPAVLKDRGYSPYCPDNPSNAFVCPKGYRTVMPEGPKQLTLEAF
jgi:hypothetical protein